ncbi:MAG: hypothetical protein BRD57_01310, partial [Proteobacteria bacterium SW_6_67_9]
MLDTFLDLLETRNFHDTAANLEVTQSTVSARIRALEQALGARLFVRGRGGGTELTGTVYEEGERAPSFSGAPDEDAAYVWVCDEFYEVESGGV